MTRRPYQPSNDPRVGELLDWLRDRSKADDYAPTNNEICERFNLRSVSSAAALVHRAERSGAIDVDRRQCGRLFSFSALNGRRVTLRTVYLTVVAHTCRKGKPYT